MTDSQPPAVTPLRPDDRRRAAEVLGRAFTDDPLWAAIMPDGEARPARLTRMFSDLIKTMDAGQGVALIAEADSVALWLPPGRTIGIWQVIKSGLAVIRSTLALPGADRKRMMKVMRQLDAKRKEHVPEPHWYLMALGTDPGRQGQGLGSALVRAGTRQADEATTLTYLETETEENVRYYEHLGFDVVEEVTAAGLDLPMWLMIRRPESGV